MRLLKQDTSFVWDEIAQLAFKALKKSLLSAPLLRPLDYSRDFILYLATSELTIAVVLVQEDDRLQEHVIYYLSLALSSLELRYSHVEKLSLATVYAVQRLHHYILLRTMTLVADVNPFQYVLSRRIVGGKFNKWIVILQEFDLDFQSTKSKISLFFVELIAEFPVEEDVAIEEDSFPDEHIFLISTSYSWYGDILVYL